MAVAVHFALVCATHRDLFQLVRDGRFREDLLHRLNGYRVRIAPLRERPDRRPLIVALFEQAGAAARSLRLSPAALDTLQARRWPGNLRELKSALGSLVALAEPGETIGSDAIAAVCWDDDPVSADQGVDPEPAWPPVDAAVRPASCSTMTGSLAELESEAARQALSQAGGRIAPAAERLGVHRSTLYRWLARGRAASGPAH